MKQQKPILNKNAEHRRILCFLCLLIAGSVGIILYLMATGNTPQVFQDVVNEYTAIHGSNKSAERNLVYLFSIAGSVLYAVYYLWSCQFTAHTDKLALEQKSNPGNWYLLLSFVVFSAIYYFVYQGTNWLLLAATFLAFMILESDKDEIVPGISFLFLCTYAVCAAYRVYALLGGEKNISMTAVVCIAFLFSIGLLFANRSKTGNFQKGILAAQLIIPFSLFLFLFAKYKNGDHEVQLYIPNKVKALIFLLVAIFVAEAVWQLRKNWNKASIKTGEIITYGTCISILSFNRFSGSGAILSTDLHHPFENIIGYSQIFELGQQPFSEYIPVSGMYSVVQGFFLTFFGHGQAGYYFLTQNLFYLICIILITIMLKRQMRGEWVLFISAVLIVMDYNRVALILPIMLLLADPRLIEQKNLWLKAWYLSSLLHGLYYPVFGAAVCLGFLPLGIWQVFTYAKSEKLRQDIKKVSFWAWWLVCFVPLAVAFPYLLGTLKHMHAMGGQTVYADGISRFGQMVADNFFAYVQSLSIRLILYYIFSFLIIISIVWMSVALCFRLGNVHLEKKKIKADHPVPAFLALSVGITMLISFSYTVIRLDINSIYARSAGVVYASFVMFLVLLDRYLSNGVAKKCVFLYAIFLVAATSSIGFYGAEGSSKLQAAYTVPEGYIYVENDPVKRLGTCFVEQSMYETIESTYQNMEKLDKKQSYLGMVGNFGLYYLCNIKGGSVIETGTIKGYGAAQETVDLLRRQKMVVGGNLSSINSYYLYHWLVTSGEYIWSPNSWRFEPNDGSVPKEDILLQNQTIGLSPDGVSLGRTASSWGLSMDTLQDIFLEPHVDYALTELADLKQIDFSVPIDGDDADFIYLEFANMDASYDNILFNLSDSIVQVEETPCMKGLLKKDYNRGQTVVISWKGEDKAAHSIHCFMGQGKLLIPLGGASGWLLNSHSELNIRVVNENEEALAVPELRT